MVHFCYSNRKNTKQIAATCFLLFSEVVSGGHTAGSGWCLKAAAVSRVIVSMQTESSTSKSRMKAGPGSMEVAPPVEWFHVLKGSAMLCCGQKNLLSLKKKLKSENSGHSVGRASQHVAVFFLKWIAGFTSLVKQEPQLQTVRKVVKGILSCCSAE